MTYDFSVWRDTGEQNIASKVYAMRKKFWFFLLGIALVSTLVLSLNTIFHSAVVASTDNSPGSISFASQKADFQSPTPTPDDFYKGYLKGEWAGHQAGVIDCEAKKYNPPTSTVFGDPTKSEYDRGYAYGEHRGYEAGYKSCYK